MALALQGTSAVAISVCRMFALAVQACMLVALQNYPAMAQDVAEHSPEPELQQIANTSVYLAPPAGFTVTNIKNGIGHASTRSTIQVTEEPQIVHRIWYPRFTDSEAAARFQQLAGHERVTRFTLEINGETIPVRKYYRSWNGEGIWFYWALFKAENSVLVRARIFEGEAVSEEDILAAFRTIRIKVEKPLSTFGEAAFEADLVSPFEYALGERSAVLLKTYPEIDESYDKPSIDIGTSDFSPFPGEDPVESITDLGFYLFPIATGFYGTYDPLNGAEPDHRDVEIVSEERLTVGPGYAHRIEAKYKGRLGVQYVWHLGGLDFLFLFAKGNARDMAEVEEAIQQIVSSLRLTSDEVEVQGFSDPWLATQPQPLNSIPAG